MISQGGDVDVLVVDDESYMAELVAEFMTERLGLTPRVETTPAGALAAAREYASRRRPLVALSDYSLRSSLTGVQVLAEVRAQRPDAALAILSGFAPQELAQRTRGARLDAVLEKPDDLDALLPALATLVETARQRNSEIARD